MLDIDEKNDEKDNEKDNGEMIHVSVLGCCVPRDVIGIYHEGEKFEVDRCTVMSPVSAVGKSPLKKPMGEELYSYDIALSHFYLRSLLLDLNKQGFSYMAEIPSEWLLMDMGNLQNPTMEYDDGLFSYIIPLYGRPEFLDIMEKEGYLSKDENRVLRLATELSDEELYSVLDAYLDKVLEIYPPEKIILFEIVPAKYCVLKNDTLSYFDEFKPYPAIKKAFDYVRKQLPECHIIEIPKNTPGSEKHKWDKMPLHYVREYYDYAYEALERITGGVYRTRKQEQEDLHSLKEYYEGIIEEKYVPCINKTVDAYRRTTAHLKCWRIYANTFKSMLESGLNMNLSDKLLEEQINSIAIYGNTEITRMLITLLKDSPVEISYVVHEKPMPGIRTVDCLYQGETSYPLVDMMFVAAPWCSVDSIATQFENLGINIPVVDASDYLIKLSEEEKQ